MFRLVPLFLLICFTPLVAEEQIVVRLATEKQLVPVKLDPVRDDNSGFSSGYLKQLNDVLRFDLNNNGRTTTGKVAGQDPFYTVRLTIANRTLQAQLFAAHSDNAKGVSGIVLSGTLAEDRRKIHKVADVIYKALFNSEGIATTKILYTIRRPSSKPGEWLSDVWEADYDGANARQLTHGAGYCVTPTYVPPKPGFSAGNFFYVSYKTGQPKIYLGSLKNGSGQRFSMIRSNQLMPTISRQRDQVAFICDVTGNPDLFLQPFDSSQGAVGKPRQIFAGHLATQGTPTFSPNGKQIAFVSDKDGSPRVYAMDIPPVGASLKEIRAKLVSKYSRGSTAPAWSPDGKKIAYCSLTDGARQIWIYDFEKDEEFQITKGEGHKENPTWSPNSLSIIFNTNQNDRGELYLVNLSGSKATKITSGSGQKRFPSWEPR